MRPAQPAQVPRGRWQCVEIMLKLNSAPDRADGELALWLDGKPIARHSISPLKLNLTGAIDGATLSFRVESPAYLILEVDDLRRLVIAWGREPLRRDRISSMVLRPFRTRN